MERTELLLVALLAILAAEAVVICIGLSRLAT